MRFPLSLLLPVLVALVTLNPARTPAKEPAAPENEPVCALIEPALMRNNLARAFAGGRQTVLMPASEVAGAVTAMSEEEFRATGLTWDEFLHKSTAAATRLLKSLQPEFVRTSRGEISHAVLRSERHFLPSVLLSPEFTKQFEKEFGDRLVAVMPDHFTIYVFSRNFGDFRSVGPRVLKEFEDSVWPCSYEVFEVSAAGAKCIGSYAGGDAETADSSPKPASGNPSAPQK